LPDKLAVAVVGEIIDAGGGLTTTSGGEAAAQYIGTRSRRQRCPHADHESAVGQPSQQGMGAKLFFPPMNTINHYGLKVHSLED